MRKIPHALVPALVFALACFCTGFALAQSAPAPLYQTLGEKPGITRLMDQFVDRLRADPRIGPMFKDVKPAFLKQQLTDQVCLLSGGPCVYDGETMKKSHADLKIEKIHFNAMVEVLQDTMDAQGVAFPTQRQLLVILAPMHRDIITR